VTHVIFKGGRASTVHRYRALAKDPKPFLVGIGWIVRCRETDARVPETPFCIDPSTLDSIFTSASTGRSRIVEQNAQSRRKSLEPGSSLALPAPSAPGQQFLTQHFGALTESKQEQGGRAS
jgi:hypothetical protein